MHRRNFLQQSGGLVAASMLANNAFAQEPLTKKKKIAMVGTGVRGLGMWGKPVLEEFGDMVEFVGLCDINKGRVETGKAWLGVGCDTYTSFDRMMKKEKPDALIVTTVDSTHHEFIIKGMEYGADIITEKTYDDRRTEMPGHIKCRTKNREKNTCHFQLPLFTASSKVI
jgi:hypothetical protein